MKINIEKLKEELSNFGTEGLKKYQKSLLEDVIKFLSKDPAENDILIDIIYCYLTKETKVEYSPYLKDDNGKTLFVKHQFFSYSDYHNDINMRWMYNYQRWGQVYKVISVHGSIYYQCNKIQESELEKIRNEHQGLFWNQVQEKLNEQVALFLKSWERSMDKDSLLRRELDRYECLFDEKKMPLRIISNSPTNLFIRTITLKIPEIKRNGYTGKHLKYYDDRFLSSMEINDYRKLKEKAIDRGELSYNLDSNEVEVIAFFKFWRFLQKMDPNDTKNQIIEYFENLGYNHETEDENDSNDLTLSTIEDWLFEFKEQKIIKEPHYGILVKALYQYIKEGVFPKLKNKIMVGKVNKKLLGWNLNRILHSEGIGVKVELLRFAHTYISTFKDDDFTERNYQKSNLYKYFTTKTK